MSFKQSSTSTPLYIETTAEVVVVVVVVDIYYIHCTSNTMTTMPQGIHHLHSWEAAVHLKMQKPVMEETLKLMDRNNNAMESILINGFLRHHCLAGARALKEALRVRLEPRKFVELMVDRVKQCSFAEDVMQAVMNPDYAIGKWSLSVPECATDIARDAEDNRRLPDNGEVNVSLALTAFHRAWFSEFNARDIMLITKLICSEIQDRKAPNYRLSVNVKAVCPTTEYEGPNLCQAAIDLVLRDESDLEMRDALRTLIRMAAVPGVDHSLILSTAASRKFLFHGPKKFSPGIACTDIHDATPYNWKWPQDQLDFNDPSYPWCPGPSLLAPASNTSCFRALPEKVSKPISDLASGPKDEKLFYKRMRMFVPRLFHMTHELAGYIPPFQGCWGRSVMCKVKGNAMYASEEEQAGWTQEQESVLVHHLLYHHGLASADALKEAVRNTGYPRKFTELLFDRIKPSRYPYYMMMATQCMYGGLPQEVDLPYQAAVDLNHFELGSTPLPGRLNIGVALTAWRESWVMLSEDVLFLTMRLLVTEMEGGQRTRGLYTKSLARVALELVLEEETDPEMKDSLKSLLRLADVPGVNQGIVLAVAASRKWLFHGPTRVPPTISCTDIAVNTPYSWNWTDVPEAEGKTSDLMQIPAEDALDQHLLNPLREVIANCHFKEEETRFMTKVKSCLPQLFH